MPPENIARLFGDAQWDAIASQIYTGTEDPDTTRALIVFNPTSRAISGVAVFHVDMPWRVGRELPSVRVSCLTARLVCQSNTTEPQFIPANPGESYGRIIFDLCFEVEDIPAHGWDTYLAEYVGGRSQTGMLEPNAASSPLLVVETTRHDGALKPRWFL